MCTDYQEEYESFLASVRSTLMKNQQDKNTDDRYAIGSRAKGIGSDVGVTDEFIGRTVGPWFEPDWTWKPRWGLSLVALLRQNRHIHCNGFLHQNLVRAQTRIAELLRDAWKQLPQNQLHMTLFLVGRANPTDTQIPRATVDNKVEDVRRTFSELREKHHWSTFAVDFRGFFQSPLDGRISAWGIPTTRADHGMIRAMREDMGEMAKDDNRLLLAHIAIGSVVRSISPGAFGLLQATLQDELSGYDKCGTLGVENMTFVHHANDHMDGCGTEDIVPDLVLSR